MKFDFTDSVILAKAPQELYAAQLFSKELKKRTGKDYAIKAEDNGSSIAFITCSTERLPHKDCFEAVIKANKLSIYAHGIRGFIFGYSMFLRKSEFFDGNITLIKDITGKYIPEKQIRGHQIGYRSTPNTYDAWNLEQYFQCYLDMMAFGCNVCEHIPYENGESKRNALMKFDEEELLIEASRLADMVDMDVSIWFPNNSNETEEEAIARRKKLFERIPRIDAVFPPGGDPGNLYADEFWARCQKISAVLKASHPNAKMFPSAQKPHEYPDWGGAFIEAAEASADGIDGIIMGPNHAYPIFDLRKKLPQKYPLRFYPDITHNVRCEYPVHYLNDDWHFALINGLSRESVNPRPSEYRTLHRQTRHFVLGGVSYSEGVHDDVNKCVWSNLDFFGEEVSLRECLTDYARMFFYGAPADIVADGIFAFEHSWIGDPVDNPSIPFAFNTFTKLQEDYPALRENWRFNLCMFRATCDMLVRERRIFELELIDEALPILREHRINEAKEILCTPLDNKYAQMRSSLDSLAKALFEQIGIQLNVKDYHANSWERGATLETIDLPVTDRAWLMNRLDYADTLPENERISFIDRVLNRNRVDTDEFYWSLTLHGFEPLGTRPEGEFYINYQGDRPNVNDGKIPMSMLKVYDNYSLKARLGEFTADTDYILRVTYSSKKIEILNHHTVIANGVTIYDGKQYGGTPDAQFDRELLCDGYETASYIIPKEVFINGTLELEISEKNAGVMLSEFWLTKRR